MASNNLMKGVHSQLVAKIALIANGWEVAEPEAPEIYDIVAKSPDNGRWYEFQVKTFRYRENRGGALVLPAVRGNNQPYSVEDFDFLLGITPDLRVFMIPNLGIWEYSAVPETLSKWEELPTEYRTSPSSKRYGMP